VRASSTLLSLGLTLVALTGCKSSVKLATKDGGDANASISAEIAAEDERTKSDSPGAAEPDPAPRSSTGAAVPAGPPIVTFPAFEVLPDGRSVVRVVMRGKSGVTEQVAPGRIVYALGGVSVPDRVNRLPLLTQNFATQVTSVVVEPTSGGANLVIELREPAKPTFKVSELDGSTVLSVVFPKSQRWGEGGQPLVATTEEPKRAGADASAEGPSSDAPSEGDVGTATREETESDETRRRRTRSKRQPLAYASRYLTLPHDTIAPDVGLSIMGYGRVTDLVGFYPPMFFNSLAGSGGFKSGSTATVTSGLRWGIVDAVELELTAVSVRLAPDAAYSYPSLGITAGFTQSDFEIAGRLRYFVGIDSALRGVESGILTAGVPTHIHVNDGFRIDTGVMLTAVLADGGTATGLYERTASPLFADPGIPLGLIFQTDESIWLGIRTGLSVFDFDAAKDTLAIPLGAELGFSQADDYNPVGDLSVRVDFPQFIRPATSLDNVSATAFGVGALYRWYYHL
jgi:hypothetical protein